MKIREKQFLINPPVFYTAAMKASEVKQEVTFPMRQNLSYEDSQALRVTRGPQPTDIEECPAYGVVNRQQ